MNIHEQMLSHGHAWFYEKYDNRKHLEDLQTEAKKNKIGLFIDENAIPPWVFRAKLPEKAEKEKRWQSWSDLKRLRLGVKLVLPNKVVLPNDNWNSVFESF